MDCQMNRHRFTLDAMSDPVPSLAFADLLAYTDYLADRWLNYFDRNPGAFDIDVGGKTESLRDRVTHIFQVENFFADLLLQEGAGSSRPPAQIPGQSLEELRGMQQEAHKKLAQYIASTNDEALQRTRTLGSVTVSNRKTLTQALLHSVHHWAQAPWRYAKPGSPPSRRRILLPVRS
jgi:uncharacterized damage-inducible protein DinB